MPESAPALRIGFIDLGVMGAPMAGHLARAGHRLALQDADAAAADRLGSSLCSSLGSGAQDVATPAAVAAVSDIVITMLPHGGVVQQVALGDGGLVHGLRPGALLLDCASAGPWFTQATGAALTQRGASMVDAPVSGAAWGAAAAELVFMVGGAAADVARMRPLLDVMGRAVFCLGAPGAGHAMKSINKTGSAAPLAGLGQQLWQAAARAAGPDASVSALVR